MAFALRQITGIIFFSPLRVALGCAVLAFMLGCPMGVSGQSQKAGDEVTTAEQAAEFLQSVAESLHIEADEADVKRLQLRKSPLLKYSDPARGYLAAGVWRFGATGRPEALVSLQYSMQAEGGKPRLDFELISLTEAQFDVKSARATLSADGTAPKYAALSGAEKPASSEKQRLVQLRGLARRFTVSETFVGDTATLRLLPQPIDRYDDVSRGIVDGGVFVFVYGTNPEAVLLLECDKEGWRYALSRLAWAELAVEFDGREVARFEHLKESPASGVYRTAGHAMESAEPQETR
jgi:hypothetical protein